jgi:leader peptidase (prepilin peptidase) / N-methyltransferase
MAAAALDASLVLVVAVTAISDLRTRLVRDEALIAGLAVVPPLCALGATADPAGRLGWGAAAAGLLLLAALFRPGGMGLGDVKLAGVLGVYLRSDVAAALVFAFSGGVLAGAVLIVRHGWSARKRTIPFAPFLGGGALLAALTHP